MITYEINEARTRLTLIADDESRENLKEIAKDNPDWFGTIDCECVTLDQLICNSELWWIMPEEAGVLTDAPILGFRSNEEGAMVTECWAYMQYEVRSFLDDLIADGKAVFVNSN